MSDNKRIWVAFVVGVNDEIKKTVASFLSFEARNRFVALQQIQKSLPESENWLLSSGELIAFKVVALHQCEPDEVNAACQFYVDQFAELAGQEPDFEGFWSTPRRDDP